MQTGRLRARTMVRLARGLMLAGAPFMVGCGNPEQGTVQIAAETRKELTPHAGPNSKDRVKESIAGKSFSIKDRSHAAPSK